MRAVLRLLPVTARACRPVLMSAPLAESGQPWQAFCWSGASPWRVAEFPHVMIQGAKQPR